MGAGRQLRSVLALVADAAWYCERAQVSAQTCSWRPSGRQDLAVAVMANHSLLLWNGTEGIGRLSKGTLPQSGGACVIAAFRRKLLVSFLVRTSSRAFPMVFGYFRLLELGMN